ncbi:MAG TPA: MgtC/SapB family protein [Thermoanaerobaculia bacterium]|nr:MgtC/SapB family protein [Thermoanaerobaculia bacterium]
MIPWHYELFKLLFAVAVGLMVGLERELRGKPAGLRTMMLIALGSTLFTIFSIEIVGESIADRGRIAAQIVTGVGFLGAGAILHDRRQVTGLTTAASIWLVASLGSSAKARWCWRTFRFREPVGRSCAAVRGAPGTSENVRSPAASDAWSSESKD